MVVDWPLQMLVVPLTNAVGRGYTVTKSVPAMSPAELSQLASVTKVTE